MKEAYLTEKNFSARNRELIETADDIIAEYSAQGYELTLRQLYYQFVARDIIPNKEQSYKLIGRLVNDGRLMGLLDWNAVVDRTRTTRANTHWDGPDQIVSAAINGYRRDHWDGQPYYVEVWVEKDALIDVVQRVSGRLDVRCFSCRGYVSQSAMYRAAQRFSNQSDYYSKRCVLLHLGDHDPSGVDMTRDIDDRLQMFDADVDVRRIALTMAQINLYNPPPNPAKLTDSRCGDYIAQYGRQSWELDALEPKVLDALITDNVRSVIDQDIMDDVKAREQREQQALRKAAEALRDIDYDKTDED